MCKKYYLNKFLEENNVSFERNIIEELYCQIKKTFKGEVKAFQYYKKMLMGSDLDNVIERIQWLLKNSTAASTLERMQMFYGKEEGIKKWDRYRQSIAMTLENQIKKYGEEEGTQRWNEYCKRQAFTNSQEYKSMADEEFKKYNESRAMTLENQIKKYGEEEGTQRWELYCDRQAFTNSLEYFIDKYGIKGRDKWVSVNKQKALTLENFQRKYGSLGEEKYLMYMQQRTNKFYSELSHELFSNINNSLKNFVYNVYYSENEFGKYDKILKKYNYYDFVIPDLNICIEFNGDVFHANPKLYKKDDKPNPFTNQTSEEIWQYDELKNKCIINEGFDLIIVWESEYNNNKKEIESKLIKYILDRKEQIENK